MAESSPHDPMQETPDTCDTDNITPTGQDDNTPLLSVADRTPSSGSSSPEKNFQPTFDHPYQALRFGAEMGLKLILPVSICMLLVTTAVLSVTSFTDNSNNEYFFYTPFHEKVSNPGIRFGEALANALILVAVVLVMTILLVLLYKFRCYKILYGWMLLATFVILFFISFFYLLDLFKMYDVPIDIFTLFFMLWNFGCTGIAAIHWKAPLKLQQAYLILSSALVSLIFIKYLPPWTAWVILIAISIYDLVAVLCPIGPLRILVNIARERDEQLFPALIYSSTMIWMIGMADRGHTVSDSEPSDSEDDMGTVDIATNGQNRNADGKQTGPAETQENPSLGVFETRGPQLGLGDFIFYSILLGKAAHDSSGDFNTILACYLAICVGLCATLLFLVIVQRALPALPISITFGVVFFFGARFVISPFLNVLGQNQVFI
ncbi:PSN [Oopsacas minuta]|uniref:Presenilin n=1 Tax=Oopsacas minuta TaxID=111878 RepID=A0A2I5KCD5_9METZ|nr:PSN [Oopsacas minuta]KAI6649294.1 PSN [Oopsacas minuta]